MNRINRILFVFALVQLLNLTSGSAQDWVQMFHDSLRFSVISPEALIEKENEAMTEVGNMTVNSFGLLPEEGDNLIYQIIVLNYPYGSLPQDSVELRTVMLNELVQQSAAANEAEVIYQQEIQNFGLTGLQWRVHSGEDISIKSRAYIFDNRIYIAQVMSKRKKSLNSDVDKFLNGFKLYTK